MGCPISRPRAKAQAIQAISTPCLNLAGFEEGGSTVEEFWTKESANNSAVLRGVAIERAKVVPEPASMLLLGAGLAGLAVRRRRQ